MKRKSTTFLTFWLYSIWTIATLSGQVTNDDKVNYRVETVEFGYNDCEFSPLGIGTGTIINTPVSFKVNDICINEIPAPPVLPIVFSESRKVFSKNNSSISNRYILELNSWLNSIDIPFKPCDFDRIELSGPLGLISTTFSDGCLRKEEVYRSKAFEDPGVWNEFEENVGPNKIKFRQVWRYTNGDAASSALNFGTFTNGTSREHTNSNRSITIGSLTNKGYTNKFSGLGSLNNSTDVVYKFTIGAGFDNYRTEISTNFSTTDFDTEIHLINNSRTQVMASNDDIGSGNLNSEIITTLSPGTYYIVVEGASSSSSEGNFKIEVSTDGVSPTPGSITQPSPAVFCSGAQLPTILSNVAGGTNIPANAGVTYKWFERVGNRPFNIIAGATGVSLPSSIVGTMIGEDLSFKRKTVLGNQESSFTNTITFTATDQIGVMRLSSNSPICSGDDGEFYLESEDGVGDAGVVINYTINGTAGSATLDASGKATVTRVGLTSASTMTLVSSNDGGCTALLTLNETIGIFDAPITISCGAVVTGNNSTGTDIAVKYTLNNGATPSFSGNEVIYTFDVLGTAENVRLSLTGLTDDLDILVVQSCDITNVLALSAKFNNEDELIDISLPVGTYNVIVDAFVEGVTSPYTLALESCGVPSICDNITDVACFETLTGEDNNTPYYFDCLFATYNSKVYKIEPANSGTMNFNVTNSTTTHQLNLYDRFCDSANCNKIANSSTILNPSLSFNVTGGTCYFLEVFGSSSPGTYDIEFDCPVSCPCTNNVDYVEVVANGDVCIGATGTYTIQPGVGANITPNGVVTYSLNGGANQTVTLNASGIATISDTPSAVGDPASTIVLSKIEVGPCSIELDSEAEFNANGFPMSFSAISTGPGCSGDDTEQFIIQGSPGVNNPTPYANVTYVINFSNQSPPVPSINGVIKLDQNGLGVIPVPAAQAGTPTSVLSLIQAEINGCVIPLSNGASITTYDPAEGVSITANATYCPGSDAVFTVTGQPEQVVEYDDTNNGSLPFGSGNSSTKFIVLDAAGQGTITVTNPAADVRIDIYTVIINPFGSNNNTFPFCKYFYDFGENYAVSERTAIGVVELGNSNIDICETQSTYWDLFSPFGMAMPGAVVDYTLNGVTGSLNTSDVILGTIYDNNPTPGSSVLTLNSIESNGCVINLSSSVTKNVIAQYQDVVVTAAEAQICAGETAVYNITPAPGATPNPAGTILTYTFDEVSFSTISLGANGEAVISLPNQNASTYITLADLSSATSPCMLQLESGAFVDVIPFASNVTVTVESDICSDGIAEFRISPDPTPSPGAYVKYILDGVVDSTFLDANGEGSVFVADESGKANDHTIVLTSIGYQNCTIPLSATATLTCDMPCYVYQTRNFLEEEVVVFQVEDYIESISTICAPAGGGTADVSYLAGTSVNLEPGFTVEPGCIFLADIDPCIAECPCGLVTSPTGSADVPNDFLRWKVNEDTTCITDLEFDPNNTTPDVEMNIKAYVSGSSGPVFADLSLRIDGSTDRIELDNAVISPGRSTIQLGIFTSDNGDAYLVQIELNYVGVIVEGTLVMSPWCITPPETACPTLGRTAQAEAPFDVLEFMLVEDPYCIVGIANADNNTPQIKVDVKSFVGGNTNLVEVEVSFVSPIGGGAATHVVNLTSGAGIVNIPTFVYTSTKGIVYDVEVQLEYNYLPAAIEADLVETVIFVSPQ